MKAYFRTMNVIIFAAYLYSITFLGMGIMVIVRTIVSSTIITFNNNYNN